MQLAQKQDGALDKVKGIATDKAELGAALEKLREASDHFSVCASNSTFRESRSLKRCPRKKTETERTATKSGALFSAYDRSRQCLSLHTFKQQKKIALTD